MSKYVIIIDNGECYSDHEHWAVATTDTATKAKDLSDSVDKWIRQYHTVYNELDGHYKKGIYEEICAKIGEPPVKIFPDEAEFPYWRDLARYNSYFIEVPHYA